MSMQINNNKSKNSKCSYCKRKGHLESNCYKKHPNLRPNNNNNTRKAINNSSSSKVEEIEDLDEVEDINSTYKVENILNSSKYSNTTIDFILDSRATIHTCYIKELFTSIRNTTTCIKQGNTSNIIKAKGIGNIELVFTSTNKVVKLQNVLYILELGVNLLSLSLITSKDFSLKFNKESCYIYTPNKSLLTKGSYKDGVSIFNAKSLKPSFSYKAKNKALAILNTSNLNETSNIELESTIENSDLDLIDANEEENDIVENAIDLEDNNN